MAFKEKELTEDRRFVPRVRIPDGKDLTIADYQSMLQEECDKNGIPVAFATDEVSTGGLMNKSVDPILILSNPTQKNYMDFIIHITYQGNYAFVNVYQNYKLKPSKALMNVVDQQSAKGGLLNKITGADKKMQEESDYYLILRDCLENVGIG